jgi:hypothetical protein
MCSMRAKCVGGTYSDESRPPIPVQSGPVSGSGLLLI